MEALLFKRTRKPRKHKRIPTQTPPIAAGSAGVAFKRPDPLRDGDMAQRETARPGRHAGARAPLAGSIASRSYTAPDPTRVLPVVPPQSDATAQMPAAASLPSSATARQGGVHDAQVRVVKTLSDPSWPMWPAQVQPVNGEWFREPDTTGNDRSLAAWHEVWSRRRADVVLTPEPAAQSMVMSPVGRASFEGVSR